MTHYQVCAIKWVQSAIALSRKVGVSNAEILDAIGVSRTVEESHNKKPLHSREASNRKAQR
jgi:hypothetical protein